MMEHIQVAKQSIQSTANIVLKQMQQKGYGQKYPYEICHENETSGRGEQKNRLNAVTYDIVGAYTICKPYFFQLFTSPS